MFKALVISPMNTSTLTCIGFVQALSKNYADAVDTFHKALGQKRDDTFSSTMLTCVLEMCIEEPPVIREQVEDESMTDEKKKNELDESFQLNDDNDLILPFRDSKFRLWNRRLKKKFEDSDSNTPMDDDSNAMAVDSSIAGDESNYNMDLSTNMSTNSDSFK